ncbi:hypothetical protein M0813_28256 [Anaeramoeba flamelloides]|uniref:Uncharacterized protein n=1 Tax=Anaeramoeba flamelloides TaxID=1746091 RepID=A0ABQ8XTV5_9EUKA|nr:hypothetical protein M0813_28256 [Anaeramoeba flamelloides]
MNNNPLIGTKRFPNGYTRGFSTTPNDIYSIDMNNNTQDIKTNSTKNFSTIKEKNFDLFESKSPKCSEKQYNLRSVFFQEDLRNFYRDLLNENQKKNKIQDKKTDKKSLNKNKNDDSDKNKGIGDTNPQKLPLTKQKERKKVCNLCKKQHLQSQIKVNEKVLIVWNNLIIDKPKIILLPINNLNLCSQCKKEKEMEFKHFYCSINRKRIYFSIQYLEEITDKFLNNLKKSTLHQPKWVTEIKKKSLDVMKKRQKKLTKKKKNNNQNENEVCVSFKKNDKSNKKPLSFSTNFSSQTPPQGFLHTYPINNSGFINQNNTLHKNSQTEKPKKTTKKRTKSKYQQNNKKLNSDFIFLFEPMVIIKTDSDSDSDSDFELTPSKLKSGSKRKHNYKHKKIKISKRKQEIRKKNIKPQLKIGVKKGGGSKIKLKTSNNSNLKSKPNSKYNKIQNSNKQGNINKKMKENKKSNEKSQIGLKSKNILERDSNTKYEQESKFTSSSYIESDLGNKFSKPEPEHELKKQQKKSIPKKPELGLGLKPKKKKKLYPKYQLKKKPKQIQKKVDPTLKIISKSEMGENSQVIFEENEEFITKLQFILDSHQLSKGGRKEKRKEMEKEREKEDMDNDELGKEEDEEEKKEKKEEKDFDVLSKEEEMDKEKVGKKNEILKYYEDFFKNENEKKKEKKNKKTNEESQIGLKSKNILERDSNTKYEQESTLDPESESESKSEPEPEIGIITNPYFDSKNQAKCYSDLNCKLNKSKMENKTQEQKTSIVTKKVEPDLELKFKKIPTISENNKKQIPTHQTQNIYKKTKQYSKLISESESETKSEIESGSKSNIKPKFKNQSKYPILKKKQMIVAGKQKQNEKKNTNKKENKKINKKENERENENENENDKYQTFLELETHLENKNESMKGNKKKSKKEDEKKNEKSQMGFELELNLEIDSNSESQSEFTLEDEIGAITRPCNDSRNQLYPYLDSRTGFSLDKLILKHETKTQKKNIIPKKNQEDPELKLNKESFSNKKIINQKQKQKQKDNSKANITSKKKTQLLTKKSYHANFELNSKYTKFIDIKPKSALTNNIIINQNKKKQNSKFVEENKKIKNNFKITNNYTTLEGRREPTFLVLNNKGPDSYNWDLNSSNNGNKRKHGNIIKEKTLYFQFPRDHTINNTKSLQNNNNVSNQIMKLKNPQNNPQKIPQNEITFIDHKQNKSQKKKEKKNDKIDERIKNQQNFENKQSDDMLLVNPNCSYIKIMKERFGEDYFDNSLKSNLYNYNLENEYYFPIIHNHEAKKIKKKRKKKTRNNNIMNQENNIEFEDIFKFSKYNDNKEKLERKRKKEKRKKKKKKKKKRKGKKEKE